MDHSVGLSVFEPGFVADIGWATRGNLFRMSNVTDCQWMSESDAGDVGRPFTIKTDKSLVHITFHCLTQVHERAILFQTLKISHPIIKDGTFTPCRDVARYDLSVKWTWQHTIHLKPSPHLTM